MPAPLAKGIIFSLSILFAAGLAAYENPEVRAWFEERRRKIALTFNEIADELDPGRSSNRRRRDSTWQDASTTEDNSAEAVERRRRARQDIMQKSVLLEQRRTGLDRSTTSSSFDHLVDDAGKLREKEEEKAATTSTEAQSDGLRNRFNQTNAITRGSIASNPFDDELGGLIEEKALMEQEQDLKQQSTALEPTIPLSIDTGAQQANSSDSVDDFEHMVDLTPTTSVAASTLLSASGVITPTSTRHAQSNPDDEPANQQQEMSAPSYQSIEEWASTASSTSSLRGPASFYSPPESDRGDPSLSNSGVIQGGGDIVSKTPSTAGTNEVASEADDLDLMSDVGADTPSSWSEIGSQISEHD